MAEITNAENLRQYQSRFSLIAEQITALASNTSLVREVKTISPNLKEVLIQLIRSNLSLNLNRSNKNNTLLK